MNKFPLAIICARSGENSQFLLNIFIFYYLYLTGCLLNMKPTGTVKMIKICTYMELFFLTKVFSSLVIPVIYVLETYNLYNCILLQQLL